MSCEADVNQMKFSERTLRIFKNAEMEAHKSTNIVYPIHLILGILRERTGGCAELFLHYPKLYDTLKERMQKINFNNQEQGIQTEFFNMKVTHTTFQVLENACNRMKRFKQVYINEGLLIKAIFDVNDEMTKAMLEGVVVSPIVEILSSPRDMIVSLKDYSIPDLTSTDLIIRKAVIEDANALKDFVEAEFGNGWLDSVENGLQEENIPIYVAIQNGKILGFACFDVVRRKKGLFGPMGTAISNRTQGIGYMLLHCCLKEMKDIGYEYAVIGEAGPLEFYEKACNAVVIPMGV
ncbi:GNAT family N-acetyltransferase [Heyndrickxia shackletonii]